MSCIHMFCFARLSPGAAFMRTHAGKLGTECNHSSIPSTYLYAIQSWSPSCLTWSMMERIHAPSPALERKVSSAIEKQRDWRGRRQDDRRFGKRQQTMNAQISCSADSTNGVSPLRHLGVTVGSCSIVWALKTADVVRGEAKGVV